MKKLRPALGSPCAGIANSIELNELNGEDMNRGTLHYLRGSWGLRSSVLSRIGLWEVPSIKRSSQWEKLSGHLTRGPNPQVMTAESKGTVSPFVNSIAKFAAAGFAIHFAIDALNEKKNDKVHCMRGQSLYALPIVDVEESESHPNPLAAVGGRLGDFPAAASGVGSPFRLRLVESRRK